MEFLMVLMFFIAGLFLLFRPDKKQMAMGFWHCWNSCAYCNDGMGK